MNIQFGRTSERIIPISIFANPLEAARRNRSSSPPQEDGRMSTEADAVAALLSLHRDRIGIASAAC
jgi:hypothetical protein